MIIRITGKHPLFPWGITSRGFTKVRKAALIPRRAAPGIKPHPTTCFPCSRYLFELARRHTNIPDVFLSKLYDATENVREECCFAKDASACLGSKVSGGDGSIGSFCSALPPALCTPKLLRGLSQPGYNHPLPPSARGWKKSCPPSWKRPTGSAGSTLS